MDTPLLQRKKKLLIVQFLFGVSLLVFIIWRTGFFNVLDSLQQIKPIYLIPIIIIGWCFLIISMTNFYLLCRTKREIPLFSFVKLFYITRIIGEYSPGRIGDFSLLVFLKKHDVPPSYTIFFTLLDKAINAAVWLLFFLVSGILLFDVLPKQSISFSPPLLLLIILIFLVLISIFVIIFYKERVVGIASKVIRFFIQHYRVVILNFFLTLLKSVIIFFSTYLLFLSLGVTVPMPHLVFAFSAVSLVDILPITIGGLGIREFIYTSIFPLAGVSMGTAVAAALLVPVIGVVSKIIVLSIYSITRLFAFSENK